MTQPTPDRWQPPTKNAQCPACGVPIYQLLLDSPPHAGDFIAWGDLAEQHQQGCQWVERRGYWPY
ncbi:MAG: hypothetical protein HY690_07380 [Chloroflexi bacterium]|nr:hypothetical protein [Chloroflexota bacterium]